MLGPYYFRNWTIFVVKLDSSSGYKWVAERTGSQRGETTASVETFSTPEIARINAEYTLG